MKIKSFFPVMALGIALISCGNGPTGKGRQSISAKDFDAKIKELPNEQLIDVRTAEEYNQGHVTGAKNINWNGGDFEQQVAALAKDQPIMVYCLSGGRSAEAAMKLEQMGFADIYEMQGGMMQWKAQGLAVEAGDVAGAEAQKAKSNGMSKADFDALLKKKEWVLIDFYADWCKPCKQMEPMLKQLAEKEKARMDVVRINADDNEDLSQLMGVDALPFLFLYHNGTMVWQTKGYTTEETIMQQVK